MRTVNSFIGSPVERLEDLRFLRGTRRIRRRRSRAPMRCMRCILRSPVAHGRIRRVDACGGVASGPACTRSSPPPNSAEGLGEIPVITMRQELLPEFKPYQQPVIAKDKVRYVGEPIAVVVADSAALAEDALEHIALDIEALPPVADRAASRAGDKRAVRGHRPQSRHHAVGGEGRRRRRRSRTRPTPAASASRCSASPR